MGDARYIIRDYTNWRRNCNGNSSLFIHEENSDAAQKHAQYVLDEILKWGSHRFSEIYHYNAFCRGEYKAENMALKIGGGSIEEMIRVMIDSFEHSHGHWNNMMGGWSHLGAEIAYDSSSNSLVLVQRFC